MKIFISLITILFFLQTPIFAELTVLFGGDSLSDNLVEIDVNTGAVSSVKTVDPNQLGDLAFDSNTGTLYSSDQGTNELIIIDPDGTDTVVGNMGSDFSPVTGLAFDTNANVLYGSHFFSGDIFTINTSTGAGTFLGSAGFSALSALVFDPNANILYGMARGNSGQLLTIDTNTGAGTVVGTVGINDINALAFDVTTNKLYGASRQTNELLEINTTTGAGTVIGNMGTAFGDRVTAMAFVGGVGGNAVPEPSSIVLLLGAISVLFLRKSSFTKI